MADRSENAQIGNFDLGDGVELIGELKLAGPKTTLSLHSTEFFDPRSCPDGYIRGSLHDHSKVSLIGCISTEAGTLSTAEGKSHFATVFPHFVLSGRRHLAPQESAISCIHFTIDDATTIFYDFDAFGLVVDARPLIRQVVLSNKSDREIAIGSDPQILYFAGKREIITANTPVGRVSANHSPSWSFPGPGGVQIRNKIRVSVEFADCARLDHAIDVVHLLRNYLGLLVGRPQVLSEIMVQLKADKDEAEILRLDWSWCPERKELDQGRKPHPADVLMDPVRRPEEFCAVLTNWLDRQTSWQDARSRFFGCFEGQSIYNVDRLIAAANMFDILPSSAIPKEVQLTSEMQEAKSNAQARFRKLAPSPERDSVLGALGRLGRPSLKRKVRFRTQVLLDAMPGRFPRLIPVLDLAIDCRNYLVHGGDAPFDLGANTNALWFLADSLEFVFATTDLIEAGWDMKAWDSHTSVSHPYGSFIRNYQAQVARFESLLRIPKSP